MSGQTSGRVTNGRGGSNGQPNTPDQSRLHGASGMAQQQGYVTPSASGFGHGTSNTASDPSVREVLGLYPFMQYTPSSRGMSA